MPKCICTINCKIGEYGLPAAIGHAHASVPAACRGRRAAVAARVRRRARHGKRVPVYVSHPRVATVCAGSPAAASAHNPACTDPRPPRRPSGAWGGFAVLTAPERRSKLPAADARIMENRGAGVSALNPSSSRLPGRSVPASLAPLRARARVLPSCTGARCDGGCVAATRGAHAHAHAEGEMGVGGAPSRLLRCVCVRVCVFGGYSYCAGPSSIHVSRPRCAVANGNRSRRASAMCRPADSTASGRHRWPTRWATRRLANGLVWPSGLGIPGAAARPWPARHAADHCLRCAP